MSAIELLEKLGADSQFGKNNLQPDQLEKLIKLSGDDDCFEPPLLHHGDEDEDEDEDEGK